MVWPHNNDIGKEKPEEPVNPAIHYWGEPSELASFHSIIDADIAAIKKSLQSMPLYGIDPGLKPNPKPKTYANTMQAMDDLLKYTYGHASIHPNDPVLIDGPKGNYSFQDKDKYPTTIPVKQLRIEMRVGGIGLDTEKMGASYLIPDHEVTETELRAILEQQFKALENLIVDNLKKAKGIK